MEGSDRDKIVSIVDTIADLYVKESHQRKLMELESSLSFINGQLPRLKTKLEVAEAKLKQHRSKNKNYNIELKAMTLIGKISEIEKQISILELKKFGYRKKYTDQHTNMVVLNQRLLQLKKEESALKKRFADLPDIQLGSIRVERGVKVAEELYMMLLKKSQEIVIAKSGIIGNVRIIDNATAEVKPIRPKPVKVFIIGILMGLFSGVLIVFFQESLSPFIKDADSIENHTQLSLLAIDPYSVHQKKLKKRRKNGETATPHTSNLLALRFPRDPSIESLRGLRADLNFFSKDNTIVNLSVSMGAGKSFVAANLAHLLSASGRVILMDGDMYRPELHTTFQVPVSPGLSDIMRGTATADNCIVDIGTDMFLLPAGESVNNPSDLFLSDAFAKVMTYLKNGYDWVVIDTPPLKNVSDAFVLSRFTDINLLIIRENHDTFKEVKQTVKRLNRFGIKMKGVVFNAAKQLDKSYGYY